MDMVGEFSVGRDKITGKPVRYQVMRCECSDSSFEFRVIMFEDTHIAHYQCVKCKTLFCGTHDGSPCDGLIHKSH